MASTPVQSTYKERMDAPRPGTISSSDFNTVTGVVETAAGIAFGLAVGQGVNSDKGTVLGGALIGFKGCSIRDITLGAETDKYPQYKNIGIVDRGQVWVSPAVAVLANDPVYYNSTTGRFYKASGAGLVGPIPGAKYISPCGIDGATEIKLAGFKSAS